MDESKLIEHEGVRAVVQDEFQRRRESEKSKTRFEIVREDGDRIEK